jgi:hypothetical protein
VLSRPGIDAVAAYRAYVDTGVEGLLESADQDVLTRNKAIVLEAFDTLFNKRDYAAAERFWLPNYVQHSAQSSPVAMVSSI